MSPHEVTAVMKMIQGLEALLLWCHGASVTHQRAQQGTKWETPGQPSLFMGPPLVHLRSGTSPCSPALLSNKHFTLSYYQMMP